MYGSSLHAEVFCLAQPSSVKLSLLILRPRSHALALPAVPLCRLVSRWTRQASASAALRMQTRRHVTRRHSVMVAALRVGMDWKLLPISRLKRNASLRRPRAWSGEALWVLTEDKLP